MQCIQTAAHIFHIYKSRLKMNCKKQLPDHGNIIYSGTLTALSVSFS